ncbi:hypothetical protein PRUPE_4G105200 [Prunus persica]|uniref:Transmembrane protein n=1 Tax=Prunus persica TaxID=3760 RepID=M5X373_PRUPE|nr:uncharacterized protein LOC18779170 [Prunus persica]ONI11407.1 hypothetical protein PRUPE_4G105200 [Prunus persica]
MGMVVVISLPFILFTILLGFGCYFFGRARGRKDAIASAQVYGVPTPPPGANNSLPSSPPPNPFKHDNSANV